MRPPRARGLVCAAVLLFAPQHAGAQSNAEARVFDVALEYAPLAGCPDVNELRTIVTGRLGYDPFREEAPNRVLVSIDSRGATLEGRLEWRDRAGEWSGDQAFPSKAGDCRELVRTMGFALAVQIHLLAIQDSAEPSSTAAPPRSEDRSSASSASATPGDAAKPPPVASELKLRDDAVALPERSVRGARAALAVGAGAAVAFGFSSRIVLFGRLHGRLYWPDVSLELGGEVGAPSTTRRADGAGVSQTALLVSGAACGTRERWVACLLVKGGVVRAEGRSVDVPASASGPVLLSGLRAAFHQRIGDFAYVDLRAEGLVNWMRWTVTLDQLPVWTSPHFVETLGVDLGVLFP